MRCPGIGITLIGAAVTSAAGIYTEWLLKRRPHVSFAVQNMQLYFYGSLFSACALWLNQMDRVAQVDFSTSPCHCVPHFSTCCCQRCAVWYLIAVNG